MCTELSGHRVEIAESFARESFGVRSREALSLVLGDALVEMEVELVVDVRVDVCAEEAEIAVQCSGGSSRRTHLGSLVASMGGEATTRGMPRQAGRFTRTVERAFPRRRSGPRQ
jgi:hypothetical protein